MSVTRLMLAIFLLLPGLSQAADDQIYSWCVTHFEPIQGPKPGKFQSITAEKKTVICTYFRSGSGITPSPVPEFPGGLALDGEKDLTCSDLDKRINALRNLQTELAIALESALTALTTATGQADRARGIEQQFYAAWSASHQQCLLAQSNFRAGVDGAQLAECNALRGSARVDCLDALYETLFDGRLGAAVETACTRETDDRSAWELTQTQLTQNEDVVADIRREISAIQRRQAELSAMIRKARRAKETCTP
jgi:hypothetical protein